MLILSEHFLHFNIAVRILYAGTFSTSSRLRIHNRIRDDNRDASYVVRTHRVVCRRHDMGAAAAVHEAVIRRNARWELVHSPWNMASPQEHD